MRNDDVYLQLYIIRHAESMGNVYPDNEELKVNPPLSEKGKNQAKALAERFRGFSPDCLYSSPLQRARETAEEISHATNSEIIIWDTLIEANTYIKDGKVFHEDESDESLEARAEFIIKTLKAKHRNHESVVLVSHGTFMSYLCNAALGIKNVDFCSYNACVTKINFREGKNPKLALQNDISHLFPTDSEKLFWM